MTRYFMRDTPLCQLEQQMMTPPNFKARGHGRYSPGFQYSSEDTECPYCINFRRNQPCPLKLCICLDERIAAGALNLNEFVRDCFFPEAGVQLLARLERNFTCCSISFFLNECHRERWQHWRERYYRMSGRNLAALFLLTAYEDMTEAYSQLEQANRTGKTEIVEIKSVIANLPSYLGGLDPDSRTQLAQLNLLSSIIAKMDSRERSIYAGALDGNSINDLNDILL